MKKDLQWFLDRVDTFVQRGTTDVFIKDEEAAQKLHDLQSDTYVFTEKASCPQEATGRV
jgi:hypothetical protein